MTGCAARPSPRVRGEGQGEGPVRMTNLPSEVDVAVIGAGAAGIAAARRLVADGRVSVLVLEARERPGGRAWTVEADGITMD